MLRLSGICKRFEDLPVLSNLSLTLSRGEIVALIGPSGCGKTTLLNIISGLTAPDAGTVEGADGRLSYMFQSARLLPWRTVEENIRLVREEAPAGEVRSLITAVGLEGFERYYPGQLSGGMARRCALARAFHFGGEIFPDGRAISGAGLRNPHGDAVHAVIHLAAGAARGAFCHT